MAEYKKFGRAQRLIVAGCMVERYRDEIREQIPEVDAVIGTGEIEKILAACEGELGLQQRPHRMNCRRIFTMTFRSRIVWRRRATPPISRLMKAATIPAPFV